MGYETDESLNDEWIFMFSMLHICVELQLTSCSESFDAWKVNDCLMVLYLVSVSVRHFTRRQKVLTSVLLVDISQESSLPLSLVLSAAAVD